MATSVWDKLALDVHGCNLRSPWLIGLGTSLPEVLRVDVVLIVLWQLWKARVAEPPKLTGPGCTDLCC